LKSLNPDYVLLLNNDTVVDKEFLNELTKAFEGDQNIGVVGPSVYLYSNPQKLQDEFKYKNITAPLEDYFMSGCCFLVKRSLLDTVGLLDPIYFLYCEESDFFARIKKFEFKVLHFPTESKVFHKSSVSAGRIPELKLYYLTRNKIIFQKKYPKEVRTHQYIIRDLFIYFVITFVKERFSPKVIYYFVKGLRDGIFYN